MELWTFLIFDSVQLPEASTANIPVNSMVYYTRCILYTIHRPTFDPCTCDIMRLCHHYEQLWRFGDWRETCTPNCLNIIWLGGYILYIQNILRFLSNWIRHQEPEGILLSFFVPFQGLFRLFRTLTESRILDSTWGREKPEKLFEKTSPELNEPFP